jgi:MFS family permease
MSKASTVEVRKIKTLFMASICFIGFSSLSIAFIPYGDFNGNNNELIIAYMIGGAFWAGILAGYSLFIILNKKRKKLAEKQKMRSRPLRGAFCFFQTRNGMVADITCGISLIASVILISAAGSSWQWITFIIISVFLFSLQMHCILNGENYKYIKFQESRGNEK